MQTFWELGSPFPLTQLVIRTSISETANQHSRKDQEGDHDREQEMTTTGTGLLPELQMFLQEFISPYWSLAGWLERAPLTQA